MSDKSTHLTREGAVERADGSVRLPKGLIVWYNELGEIHREDGPVATLDISSINRIKPYWGLNGKEYTFNEWCIKLNKTDKEKMLLRLQYG
jgi:hypothetical protein